MSVVIHKAGLNKTLGQKSADYLTTDLVGDFDPSTGVETEYWDNKVTSGKNLRRFNSIATAGTTPKYWAFDGTDDYLGAASTSYGGDPLQLNIANDLTLTAWVKSGPAVIFGLGDAHSGGIRVYGRATGGEAYLDLKVNGTTISPSFARISDWGKWNYVGIVKEGNVYSVYINGTFITSSTISGATGTHSLEVGRALNDSTYDYSSNNKRIGIVLIYDNNITNSQLRQNFLATHDINNTRIYGTTYSA
jgi:hypothetical protein